MSAFLGPIHFWVYSKIQLQQGIVEEIIELGKDLAPGLREELDTRYDVSEMRPLAEVIDEGNIHGWLQHRVSQSEYKLAYSVTTLAQKDPDILKKMEAIYQEKGKEKSVSLNIESPAEVYKVITDSLLDGMPCDHANTVMIENDEIVQWKRNSCVHKNYWEEVGGDISIYYSFRDAFIRGLLTGTTLTYQKVDEVTNRITRSDDNE